MMATLMECVPGASIQALDGTRYIDDGHGRIEIASEHLREALAAGWQIADQADDGLVNKKPDNSDSVAQGGAQPEVASAAPPDTPEEPALPAETGAKEVARPRSQQKQHQ